MVLFKYSYSKKYFTFCLLCLIFIVGCKSVQPHDKGVIDTNTVLNFVNSKRVKFSTSRKSIPVNILDSLKKMNEGKFYLGDSSEIERIKLTDVTFDNTMYLDKLLHFILMNDDNYLLVYTQGGRGMYTVIDYIYNKERFTYLRFETLERITDSKKLKNYLELKPSFKRLR